MVFMGPNFSSTFKHELGGSFLGLDKVRGASTVNTPNSKGMSELY
jgi:hypothetical protein